MELNKKCISDIDVTDKRVVIRADFDVLISAGRVFDREKILATFPTIKYALDHQCHSILLISHVGEPDGINDPELSLRPVADELNKLLASEKKKILFLDDLHIRSVHRLLLRPPKGSVLMLENIRFYMEEIGCTRDKRVTIGRHLIIKFRRTLRRYGDVYVNDAFQFCHLPHSSMVSQFFEIRVTGFLLRNELEFFQKIVVNPVRPFVAVLGGDKIKTKLKIMNNLLRPVDDIIVAGALPFTFQKEVADMKIGNSVYSRESSYSIRKLLKRAQIHNVKLHFPHDYIGGHRSDNCIPLKVCFQDEGIPDGIMGLDIAPRSMFNFTRVIQKSKTILWHGPLGFVENEKYEDGTMGIMQAIIEATRDGATSLIVGEETIAFCQRLGMLKKFSHAISGDACTHLLLGKKLPGIRGLNHL